VVKTSGQPNVPSARKTVILAAALLLGAGAILYIVPHYVGSAAPSASEARLKIDSNPTGATIIVNGRLMGATPVVLDKLPLGTYGLRLEKFGYQIVHSRVTLGPVGAALTIAIPALPVGSLKVDIKPDGAEVLLDGEIQGHTPLELAAVPAGPHELLIRKTNYHAFSKSIEIAAGQAQVFHGFALDDKVLEMLNGNIAKEDTRVAHYMDRGHYLFVNDRLQEAATDYCKALELTAEQLTFPDDMPAEEQKLLMRLRAEDRRRLQSQMVYKETWPHKDVADFIRAVEGRRAELNRIHLKEWPWVSEQASFYSLANRPDEAQALLSQYTEANQGDKTYRAENVHLALLGVLLKARKLPAAHEVGTVLLTQFGVRADVMRLAGDAVAAAIVTGNAKNRPEMLHLADVFFRAGAKRAEETKAFDMQALCEFQLASVLAKAGELDAAVAAYKQSLAHTKDPAAHEQRALKLADAYRSQHDLDDARAVLLELTKSPRTSTAAKARQDLDKLAPTSPSARPTQP
jgi:tetratricopeptide (TPR) repeat protein